MPGASRAGQIEDARQIPTSITMREGEVRRWKKVNLAGTSDHKVAKVMVMNGLLTLTAGKPGLCFIFVYPPNAAGPEAIKAASKRRISVHVTP
jgi:hypothetical protein